MKPSIILERRSVRSYKKEQISNEALNKLIESATLAPSARNEQAWFFVIIQKEELIHEIGSLVTKDDRDPYYGAPTLIVCFAKKEGIAPEIDTALAMSQMMFAATEEGLGTCWIHHTKDVFNDPAYHELSEACGVPEGYTCIGSLVVGIPNGAIQEPSKRKQDVFSIIR